MKENSEEYIIKITPTTVAEDLVKLIVDSPSEQIIIEVSSKAELLNDEVNLRLIKFYAEEADRELILKSSDNAVIALAQQLGISTIFERSLAAEAFSADDLPDAANESESPRNGLHFKNAPAMWLAIGTAVLFLMILSLCLFWRTQVAVMVYPKEQYLEYTVKVSTSSEYTEKDLPSGKLPAQLFEKTAEIEVRTKPSGTKIIGVTPAKGRVMVFNNSDKAVVLPKGTIFTAKNGLNFISEINVVVPKKTTKYRYGIEVGQEYGEAEIPITAEKPGSIGNLPARSVVKCNSPFNKYLNVSNLNQLSQGTDKQVLVSTAADYERGEKELKQRLLLSSDSEAQSLVKGEFIYLPETLQLEMVRLESSPALGEEATEIVTTMEYKLSTLAPSRDTIKKFLDLQSQKNLPPDFTLLPGGTELLTVQSVNIDNRSELTVTARAKIRGVLDKRKIQNLLKGQTLSDAQAAMTALPEVAVFRIDSKKGSKTLPNSAMRIKVIFPGGNGK